MTRIDFYIIASRSDAERLQFVAKLVGKAFNAANAIYVHCGSTEQQQALSDCLWQMPNRFIPHGEASESVHLGIDLPKMDFHDVYINLSSSLPPQYSRFNRLIEIIDQADSRLHAGRERFKAYQQKGYPLHKHDLRAPQSTSMPH
ncbi:MAG: DNA polymerase III subunit chi [Cellvibrionales bacterium]|nr:DNA polymerase III subunit chi [Cellvibrionales bacterium]